MIIYQHLTKKAVKNCKIKINSKISVWAQSCKNKIKKNKIIIIIIFKKIYKNWEIVFNLLKKIRKI